MIIGRGRGKLLATAVLGALSLPASAQAADFYVDDDSAAVSNVCTQAEPCPTVAAGVARAVAAAGTADTILVDGGSYLESDVILSQGNSLLEQDFNAGDGDSQAEITAGTAGSAIRVQPSSAAGTISGFDFIRGTGGGTIGAIYLNNDATVTENTVSGVSGSHTAIMIDGGNPTVDQNEVTSTAGGVGIYVGAGAPAISRNTLSGVAHAVSVVGGTPTISRNSITGISDPTGLSSAEGIAIQNSSATITQNSISNAADPVNDFAIGIHVAGAAASATLRRNRVSGHQQGYRLSNAAAASMNSDLAYGNNVGLIAIGDSSSTADSVTARNVTLVDNQLPATNGSPAADVKVFGTGLTLDSSIVESPIQADANSTCAITFSRGPTTAGAPCQQFQTTADPQFADPAAGDYHLSATSPMIDAGNPASPAPPNDQDFDGQPRAQDGDCDPGAVRDIGVDEREPADCEPPETTIESGPSGTSADATPTFTFSSDEAGSSFECRVDGGAFAPCSGPGDTHTPASPLVDGPHSFEVRATDPVGNVDASPASRNFAVDTSPPDTSTPDTTPPQTVLTKTPKKRVVADRARVKAKFRFSSDEPGSRFECKLDREAFKPCDGGRLKRKVKIGRHTFSVRAIDAARNPDPTPATWRWRVVGE